MRAKEIKDIAETVLTDTLYEQSHIEKKIRHFHRQIADEQQNIEANFRQFTQAQLTENIKQYSADIQNKLKQAEQQAEQDTVQQAELKMQLKTVRHQLMQAREQLAQAKEKVRLALEADPQWQQLQAQCEKSARALEESEELFAALKAEVAEKLPAYTRDPALLYLIVSGFGTAQYDRKGLFARLDGFLARRIDFTEQKRHYDLLCQMQRAAEKGDPACYHQNEADNMTLLSYEKLAYDNDDIAALNNQIETLSESENNIDRRHRHATQSLAQYEKGVDRNTASAHDEALSYLAQLDESQLLALAEQTGCDSDNNALLSIQQAKRKMSQARQAIIEQERLLEQATEKMNRALHMKSTVSQSQFSGTSYRYPNAQTVKMIMMAYLNSEASSTDWERRLLNERRTIPTPSSSTSYSNPYSSSRSGGFSSSSGLGRSGGFSTSSSIGSSGGFRTTGGF